MVDNVPNKKIISPINIIVPTYFSLYSLTKDSTYTLRKKKKYKVDEYLISWNKLLKISSSNTPNVNKNSIIEFPSLKRDAKSTSRLLSDTKGQISSTSNDHQSSLSEK